MASSRDALPKDKNEWLKMFEPHLQANESKSIHQRQDFDSGSSIERVQFLQLRVLWKEGSKTALSNGKADWILDKKCWEDAIEMLDKDSIYGQQIHWPEYLESLQDRNSEALDKDPSALPSGTFHSARLRQHQVIVRLSDQPTCQLTKFHVSPPQTRSQTARQRQNEPDSPSPLPRGAPTGIGSARLAIDDSSKPEIADDFGFEALSMNETHQTPESSSLKLATPLPPALSLVSPFGSVESVQHDASFIDPKEMNRVAEDEQIVNGALIDFLNAIIPRASGLVWSDYRHPFNFIINNGLQGFQARVDGVMRAWGRREVLAIAEVKPFSRYKNRSRIRMQESAQMSSWICEYPEFKAKGGNRPRCLLYLFYHLPNSHDRLIKPLHLYAYSATKWGTPATIENMFSKCFQGRKWRDTATIENKI